MGKCGTVAHFLALSRQIGHSGVDSAFQVCILIFKKNTSSGEIVQRLKHLPV